MKTTANLIAGVICSLVPLLSAGETWPRFLGPDGAAAAAKAEIPAAFGPGENELWQLDTPEGHSSPCIWGNHIFLTGYRDETTLVMQAIDRRKGKLLWERTVEANDKESFVHVAACPAMPTPCTDGKHVVFFFGAYGLQTYTFDGELVWEKKYPLVRSAFGTGSSPILVGDSLFVVRDEASDPSIVCLDVEDGRERWKRPRIGYGSNYATPILWENELRRELVVPGTTDIVSLDPKTGDLIWEVKDTCALPCTSPVASKDMLYYAAWTTMHVGGRARMESAFDEGTEFTEKEVEDPKAFIAKFDKNKNGDIEREELPPSRAKDAFRFMDRNDDGIWQPNELAMFFAGGARDGRNIMVAIKPGGKGNVTDTHVVWERSKRLPYVPSPLVSGERVYVVKDGGIVSCLDGKTGDPFFDSKRLKVRGEFYASPVVAGDKVLLTSASGVVSVIRDGKEFEVLAQNDFKEEIYATPAVIGNALYVRSKHHLWAFAKK